MKYINSECNLLKENHHENILKYLDVLIEGKIYYLLTEYYQVLILYKFFSSLIKNNLILYL
jgi:hypothetical protein